MCTYCVQAWAEGASAPSEAEHWAGRGGGSHSCSLLYPQGSAQGLLLSRVLIFTKVRFSHRRLGLHSPPGGAPKLLRGRLVLRAPQRAWHITSSQMTPAGPNNSNTLHLSFQPPHCQHGPERFFSFFFWGVGWGKGEVPGYHRRFQASLASPPPH